MKESRFSPDDPRLTAYALGELDPAETAAVEAALRNDPVAREIVADIRATAAQLEAALGAEPVAAQAGARLIPEQTGVRRKLERRYARRRGWANVVRFPQAYYLISGAAAAVFTVLAILQNPRVSESARNDAVYGELTAERRARAIIEASNEALRERLALYETQLVAGATRSAADAAVAPTLAEADRPGMPAAPAINFTAQNFPVAQTKSATGPAPSPVWTRLPSAPPPMPTAAIDQRSGDEVVKVDSLAAGALQDLRVQAASNMNVGGLSSPSAPLVPRARVDLYSRWYSPRNLDDGGPAAKGGRNSADAIASKQANEFVGVWQNPSSSFSLDVETSSYAIVRRFLQGGKLPPVNAVKIEELLNYFPYRYTAPVATEQSAQSAPFAAALEVSEAPWAPGHRLVRIGLKGREDAIDTRVPANLVFLLDVSGSMTAANKLPLVKRSIRVLLGKLRPDDRVAIVTYAGKSGLALPSTRAANRQEIAVALESLTPSIWANGSIGIQLAYDVAKASFVPGGINRVILCTDGDFNLGVVSEVELMGLIDEKARAGLYLTALGFGMGDYGDEMIERLAAVGHGHYGYIDTQQEAEYILDEQINSTHLAIAKDVRIQVEFNPGKVASYRLIGFENRTPARKDAKTEQIDASEVGVGHTMTALYEVVPVVEEYGSETLSEVDDLKYQEKPVVPKKANLTPAVEAELLTVKLRYKEPASDDSRLVEFALTDAGKRFEEASPDFKFAAAVAQFGMQLQKSPHKGVATVNNVIDWAAAGTDGVHDDPGGLRREFIELVRQAEGLMQ